MPSRDQLKAWSKITHQLYIWHYNTNFAHYLLPFPDFDELAADLPMYKDHGVVGLFMEGSVTQGGGAENAELRSYVMAKLLWDTKADVQRAIDEFYEAYYGKAAPQMHQYFELMPPTGADTAGRARATHLDLRQPGGVISERGVRGEGGGTVSAG